jgi:hypothetical protein
MKHSYVAYIDESGDDGLGNFKVVGRQGGSSHWLVISCCIARYMHDLEFVKWRDNIKTLMPNSGKRDMHFRKLNHSQRILACKKIAELPLRTISILSNKKLIRPDTYREKNLLYWYVTRYLIERLSWLCRDMRPSVPEGDGRVKIIFSKRGGMNYEDFRNYLRRLKQLNDNDKIRIHWPVIDIEAVEANDHSSRAGLQLVDCIASSFRAAVEQDVYGIYEPRYAKELRGNTYQRAGKYLSYGLKPIPNLDLMNINLDVEQIEFFNFFS